MHRGIGKQHMALASTSYTQLARALPPECTAAEEASPEWLDSHVIIALPVLQKLQVAKYEMIV